MRGPIALAVAVACSAGCGSCEPEPKPDAVPSAAVGSTPPPPASPTPPPAPPPPPPKLACRAITVEGDVHVATATPDAGPLVPILLQGLVPTDGWFELAPKARLVAKDPRTTRETAFRGPGRARACVGYTEESWLAAGSFESAPGAGESPGNEEWVVTPIAVLRYASAKATVDVRKADVGANVTEGVVFAWVPEDVHARSGDGGAPARMDDGWLRVEGASVTLTPATVQPPLDGARSSVTRCASLSKQAHDLTSTLMAGGADASTVAAQVVARRSARAACAVAGLRVGALPPGDAATALLQPLADANAAWSAITPP